MKAFKCDRCAEFFEGIAPMLLDVTHASRLDSDQYYTPLSHHVCEPCKEDFACWMRREPSPQTKPAQPFKGYPRPSLCPECDLPIGHTGDHAFARDEKPTEEQAFMKRMHEQTDYASQNEKLNRALSCPNCLRHGIQRIHGLMEVCPHKDR